MIIVASRKNTPFKHHFDWQMHGIEPRLSEFVTICIFYFGPKMRKTNVIPRSKRPGALPTKSAGVREEIETIEHFYSANCTTKLPEPSSRHEKCAVYTMRSTRWLPLEHRAHTARTECGSKNNLPRFVRARPMRRSLCDRSRARARAAGRLRLCRVEHRQRT